MSKRSNTFPYTNAAREGRTQPGLIEDRATAPATSKGWLGSILKPKPAAGVVPNRADLRARGVRGGKRDLVTALRPRTARVARPRCQHGTPMPYPWSTPEVHCQKCAVETTNRLLTEQRAAEEAAGAVVKPVRRRRTPKAAEASS